MSNLENNMPLVSIYMPTHFRGLLVERAVESVLNQSYRNIELIICVDGKDEKTISLLNDFTKRDNRITFVVNDLPRGACFSRNRCIQLAKGEFITGIDDDDEFTRDRISTFINIVKEKGIDIVSASRFYKDVSLTKVGDVSSGIISFKDMCNRNLIGNQLFTKTEYLKKLNGFDESFLAWQDYDMWFRLIKRFGGCYKTSEPTYIFYVDSNRPRITTSSNSYSGYNQFIDKHIDDLSKTNLRNLFFQDRLNRNDEIGLILLFKNFTLSNLKIYLKLKVKKINFVIFIYKIISKKNNYKL